MWNGCGEICPKFLPNVIVGHLFWIFDFHTLLVEFSSCPIRKANVFRKTFFKVRYEISYQNENCVPPKDNLKYMYTKIYKNNYHKKIIPNIYVVTGQEVICSHIWFPNCVLFLQLKSKDLLCKRDLKVKHSFILHMEKFAM